MRAIWSGSISFGLVNIPVRVYSGSEEVALDLDLLHKEDMSPIRYAKKCKVEDVEVPNDEIVRGFEYRKGEYVILTDEDFEKANVARTKSIEIMSFADEPEIGSAYFDRPYYLEPDRGADHSYALLRDALAETGKVGVARYVVRNREHLGALKPQDSMLMLNQLRFPSEIRKPEGLRLPGKVEGNKQELEMAQLLIDRLSRPFDPEEYYDTYTDELKRIIEEKAEGRVPVAVGEEPKPTEVADLVAMLKASLDQQKEMKKAS